jgi:DNA replication protein DnaC
LPALHDVLEHRYGHRLQTILTSNLDWQGIQNVFGPRMADRLTERATLLTFNGKSHRRRRRDAYLTSTVNM